MTIAFIGLSHLGILYATATAAKGFQVTGFDTDAALCGELSAGRFRVAEPGLPELFQSNRERLQFTSDLALLKECDVVFFSLDVPTDSANQSNLEPLRNLIALAAPHIASTATVVILCQVHPGFCRSLAEALAEDGQSLGAALYYQVETLVFGRAVERALHPERYMIGCANPGAPLQPPYSRWLEAFGCPLLPMRYESAELAKISINFFLVSSVATTNTLAEVCEQVGADWAEIAPALRLDARIGPKAYLTPGLGIAGGNLERDLVTVKRLTEGGNADTGIVDAWQRNSAHRKEWTIRTLREAFAHRGLALEDATVAVWGLAYKEDTHSTKNSPSLRFIAAFDECRKKAYDPVVRLSANGYPSFQQCGSGIECCIGANALVIPTPWPEFRRADLSGIRETMTGDIILDPFGMLDGAQALRLGFDYYRLGAPALLAAAASQPLH
jgi:UDPglucose 6-dehydrogenase